jgi:hypothetical protein
MRHFLKAFSVVTALFIATGCGVANQKAETELKEAVLMFNEGVRWGRLQEVMPRMDPKNTSHFIKMHEKFGTEIQLSDYELVSSFYDSTKQTAAVTVKITWYRQSEMELHTTILLQSWEYHAAGWLLVTETYQSGEAF